MIRGGTPAAAMPSTRARGVSPWRSTAAAEASSKAAAPSFTPEALPAVTVPGLRTTGFSSGERRQGRIAAGMLVFLHQLRCALARMAPRPGVISSARKPDSCAATARCCERSANACCASRWIWNSSARFSAVSGMESMPYCASIRGLTKRQPMVVSSILGAR